jgi:hypothetical protein
MDRSESRLAELHRAAAILAAIDDPLRIGARQSLPASTA